MFQKRNLDKIFIWKLQEYHAISLRYNELSENSHSKNAAHWYNVADTFFGVVYGLLRFRFCSSIEPPVQCVKRIINEASAAPNNSSVFVVFPYFLGGR